MLPEPAPSTTSSESPQNDLRSRVARLETEVADLRTAMQGSAATVRRPMASLLRRAAADAVPVPPPAFVPVETPRKDLESELGAKVLSKVAVLLLLTGAAWFLKWAFDNRWIGAGGRVAIGLLAGAGVIAWSEHFRKTGTPSFSYALKAVGSGVLYMSLWTSFQLYHQVPATVALLAMIMVTAWNAFLAWRQDSRLLAGYALLGAYVTPLLLSTGGNHEVFLFCYLGSIALGLLALLHVKKWNLLVLGPLPVNTAFFIGWYVQFFSSDLAGKTLLLILLLWAVMAATPLFAAESDDGWMGVLQPIGVAIFGALAVYSVLVDSARGDWKPWAAVGFAAIYLAVSRVGRGSALSAIHLSLSLTFLTVAIPLKATGHGITIGWLAESLAVLWMARMASLDARARVAMRWLGIVAMLLGTGGALLGPTIFTASTRAFVNRDFATAMAAVLTLAAAIRLVERDQEDGVRGMAWLRPFAFVLLNIVLLLSFEREIALALNYGDTADFAFSGWMALQGAVMLLLGFWKREALARWTGLLLLAATIIKMVLYDTRTLGTGYRVVSYLGLGVVLMAVSFAYQKNWLKLGDTEQ